MEICMTDLFITALDALPASPAAHPQPAYSLMLSAVGVRGAACV
jgi:hypothetical protein